MEKAGHTPLDQGEYDGEDDAEPPLGAHLDVVARGTGLVRLARAHRSSPSASPPPPRRAEHV